MKPWLQIRGGFLNRVRALPLLTNIGQSGKSPEIISVNVAPVYLNVPFWSERTHEAEALAREHLSDAEIDGVIDDVAGVIDEDLLRFDPLIAYFARFFPDGDPRRIDDEREVALSVKRDLGWAAIERLIEHQGFFTELLPWYEKGRWPCDWAGKYPTGHVLVL